MPRVSPYALQVAQGELVPANQIEILGSKALSSRGRPAFGKLLFREWEDLNPEFFERRRGYALVPVSSQPVPSSPLPPDFGLEKPVRPPSRAEIKLGGAFQAAISNTLGYSTLDDGLTEQLRDPNATLSLPRVGNWQLHLSTPPEGASIIHLEAHGAGQSQSSRGFFVVFDADRQFTIIDETLQQAYGPDDPLFAQATTSATKHLDTYFDTLLLAHKTGFLYDPTGHELRAQLGQLTTAATQEHLQSRLAQLATEHM